MNRALRRQQKKMQAKQTKSALHGGTVMERLNAGAALHKQRKYAEAVKYYDSVLAEQPENTDAMFLKGASFVASNHYDKAIELLKHCLNLKEDIAPAHHNIGLAYKEKNMLPEAIEHLERAAELDPSNSLTKFHLETAKAGNTDKSSTEYVKNLYDRAAGVFEDNLLGHLDYKGPEVMWKLLQQHCPDQRFENVIDLGCGTGLMGVKIRDICGTLKGMDLSDSMVEEAKKKKVYDELHVASLTDYLENDGNTYDMITCVDVFIYIKDLEAAFEEISKHLKTGAIFAYSLEKLDDKHDDDIWVDPKTHRHKHKQSYVRMLADKYGLEEIVMHEEALRLEHGKPVPSSCVIVRKK